MPILLCVPYLRKKCHRHFQDLAEWYALNKERHDLRQHFIDARPLHEAQATAVERAREMGCTHILFTEEDHWNYPINGLDVLLDCDKDVIGFQTYGRNYPYCSQFLRKENPNQTLLCPKPKRLLSQEERRQYRLQPIQGSAETVAKVDLLTWAFTLVKTDVFDRIQDPFRVWGYNPTDSYFCQYCEDAGIDRWGHFGTVISHGDFGPEEIPARRRMYEQLKGAGPVELPPMAADEPLSRDVRGNGNVGLHRRQGAAAAG